MPVSIGGNQRTDYRQFVDAFKKTLLVFRSEDADNHGAYGHKNAKYNIPIQSIQCNDNQIITAYVHSADIPVTTYNINRRNDTFYVYLTDWTHKTFSGGGAGIVPVKLTNRNYTAAELKIEMQAKLDALVDSTFSTEFTVAAGVGATNKRQTGYVGVLVGNQSLQKEGADADKLKDFVSGYTGASGVPTSAADGSFVYNTSVLEFTTSTTKISRVNIALRDGVGADMNSVLFKSQPRFEVTIEETDRIKIKRIDLLGFLPPTGADADGNPFRGGEFKISAGKSNYLHLGLNKPKWTGSVPNASSWTDEYNQSGKDDDTRNYGNIMKSRFQNIEFGTIQTKIQTPTAYNHTSFFPNVINVNCMSVIMIRSNALRANVRDTGKQSNIVAKIPINVQQGAIINYEPQNPVRFNLGRQNLSNIDISMTDRDGHLLDFNGCPHDLTILFEVFDVVTIPLNRNDDVSYKDRYGGNMKLTDAHFDQVRSIPEPLPQDPRMRKSKGRVVTNVSSQSFIQNTKQQPLNERVSSS